MLDAIDMERGTKVSGSRFYFLKGVGARLEFALMMLALDRALQAGFVPLIPPTLVRPEVMRGTGFLGSTPTRSTTSRSRTCIWSARARFRSPATTWTRSST